MTAFIHRRSVPSTHKRARVSLSATAVGTLMLSALVAACSGGSDENDAAAAPVGSASANMPAVGNPSAMPAVPGNPTGQAMVPQQPPAGQMPEPTGQTPVNMPGNMPVDNQPAMMQPPPADNGMMDPPAGMDPPPADTGDEVMDQMPPPDMDPMEGTDDEMVEDPEMNTDDPGMEDMPPASDLPPNPSGLPEPGAGGVARPSGSPGNLVVIPWAGFAGAMTYTFDDANSTQINNESQLLGLGVPFTWYLQTGKQEANNDFYRRALEAGHELGNHTQNHGSGSADQDINNAQQFIESNFSVTAHTMAAPNGSTGNYTNIASQLFIIDRGVSDRLIKPDDNVDLLNLPTMIPPTGAGSGQLNPKADAAQSQGGWQTVCIHGFTGGSDGAYQPIDLNGFVQHVEYTKEKGDVWIGTMVDVGAYFIGRKAVASAMAQMDGDSQTWSWNLPDNFPPDRYVRITVDGGTPMQDGAALPWNEHGFYEVALDVGSLTLAP